MHNVSFLNVSTAYSTNFKSISSVLERKCRLKLSFLVLYFLILVCRLHKMSKFLSKIFCK